MTRPSLADDATPEAYAEAMVRCLGYPPACSDAQECGMDGFCFSSDGKGFGRVLRSLQRRLDQDSLYDRVWLKVAINALQHHRMLNHRALDAMRYTQIDREVRRQYGWRDK